MVGALLELAESHGDAPGSFEQEGYIAVEGRSASPVAQGQPARDLMPAVEYRCSDARRGGKRAVADGRQPFVRFS